MRISELLLVWIGLSLLLTVGARAQVLVPQAPQAHPIQLERYQVDVRVVGQLAQVKVSQLFYNPNDRALEGTYLFPLPEGASVSSLSLCTEGECAEGVLLDANQARGVYQDIVRRTLDPALLQWVGNRAFQVRVFPLPARGEKTVVLQFQQLLPRQGNTVSLVLPSGQGARQVVFEAELQSQVPIAGVFSPSAPLALSRSGDGRVHLSFEAKGDQLERDLAVYFTLSSQGMGFQVWGHRKPDEPGFFTLLLSPDPQTRLEPLPKDIVFVFDVSGSMQGDKLDQAKAALQYALERLNPRDRFALVTFSDTLQSFAPRLVPAYKADQAALERFLDSMEAGGGTDVEAALQRGLHYFEREPGRPQLLVFLTDGEATVGETDPAKIVARVEQANRLGIRLFTFGVGYDVNAHLLDRLSLENGGATTYVTPGRSLEREVASFYDQVGTPLLSNLKLDFGGAEVYDLYPRSLPDLFGGTQLQLFGRYRQPGTHTVTLSARRGSEQVELSFEVSFPAEGVDYGFLPRIWAARKVAALLQQIQLYGEDEELVQTVKDLAMKYGIVTPYTSYLAAPDGEGSQEDQVLAAPAPPSSSGKAAVQYSIRLKSLSGATTVERPRTGRWVDGTVFVRDAEGRWAPQGVAGEPDLTVRFGSRAYFALAEREELRALLALGTDVVVPLNGMVIRVARDAGISDPARLSPPTGPGLESRPSAEARLWLWVSLGVGVVALVSLALVLRR